MGWFAVGSSRERGGRNCLNNVEAENIWNAFTFYLAFNPCWRFWFRSIVLPIGLRVTFSQMNSFAGWISITCSSSRWSVWWRRIYSRRPLNYNSPAREGRIHTVWNLVFIVGLYLTAASYGDHEVTNYLHFRLCLDDTTSDLCRIVIFNDDEFSHWVFFTGFVMMNAALLFLQNLFPHKEQLTGKDTGLLIVNSIFLGAGILANLGFEEIGLWSLRSSLTCYSLIILSLETWQAALFIYYTSAYWIGLLGGLIAQAFR